jgi:hypothetical protein
MKGKHMLEAIVVIAGLAIVVGIVMRRRKGAADETTYRGVGRTNDDQEVR